MFWKFVWNTAKNTVISPDFLVRKFCGKAQFPHSFRWFARNYAQTVLFCKISAPGNQVKPRYFSYWKSFWIMNWKQSMFMIVRATWFSISKKLRHLSKSKTLIQFSILITWILSPKIPHQLIWPKFYLWKYYRWKLSLRRIFNVFLFRFKPNIETYSAWKVALFVVFVVRIFPHSGWIQRDTPCRDTEYLSVFSTNAGKDKSEKLQIWRFFIQC